MRRISVVSLDSRGYGFHMINLIMVTEASSCLAFLSLWDCLKDY